MSGIIELSIPSLHHAPSTGTAPIGRSGDLVTVRVATHLGGNRWQVTIKGEYYPVTSSLSLQVGSILRAELFRTSTRVYLKVESPLSGGDASSSLGRLIRELGLPDDSLSRLAIVALQQSGLAASADMVRPIRAGLERSGSADSHLARLLALLVDRHLELPAEVLESLYRLGEGWIETEGGEGGDNRQGEGRRRTGEGRQEQVGLAPEEPEPRQKPLKSVWLDAGPAVGDRSERSAIAWALRKQLQDDRSEASPLSLFNHHRPEHDNWIILPFALRVGERDLRGSVRFLLNSQGKPAQCSVVVAGEGEHPRASFAIRGGRSRRLAWYLDGLAALPKNLRSAALRELPALRENLRNLGIEVDDIMRDGDRFDGFTEGRGPNSPVDWTA